jgi:hypothetical protein
VDKTAHRDERLARRLAVERYLEDVAVLFLDRLVAGSTSDSSHVSHDPHGVAPPAQFRTVPARLVRPPIHAPAASSNSIVVVPPPAPSS